MRRWFSQLYQLWIFLCCCCLPRWWRHRLPRQQHPHQRRFTADYRHKKRWAKNLWLAGSPLMLLNPELPVVILISLLLTLMTFALLDETE